MLEREISLIKFFYNMKMEKRKVVRLQGLIFSKNSLVTRQGLLDFELITSCSQRFSFFMSTLYNLCRSSIAVVGIANTPPD